MKSLLALVGCLLFGVAPCSAAKIYSYIDEHGNRTFSDRPLEGRQAVTVTTAEHVEYRERFQVRDEGVETRRRITAVNGYFGPVEVELSVLDAENMAASVPLPARFVVPPRDERELLRLYPADPRRASAYSIRSTHVFGDPDAVHAPEHPYLPPIPAGTAFPISQAFKGKTSHQGPQNGYAVDIAVPVGTPVHASRSGTIMDVSSDFYDNGLSPAYAGRANAIRILHDDGTMAVYAHLELESAQYPIGARVEEGDVIARSGNTGYSTGPHLHFVIQRNVGLELRAIPFEFRDPREVAFTPVSGAILSR